MIHFDYCATFQRTMENRVILQVDQTAPEDQGFLWQLTKCRVYPDLDRIMHISSPGYCKKALANQRIIIYDVAGHGILYFR